MLTVTLVMVLPALAGGWVDLHWVTSPWLTMLGSAIGLASGLWYLLSVTGSGKRARRANRS